MARSPRSAKPFHFSLFVSLQLLIFMITPPDITPHRACHHLPSNRRRKKKKEEKNEQDLKTRVTERRSTNRARGFSTYCYMMNKTPKINIRKVKKEKRISVNRKTITETAKTYQNNHHQQSLGGRKYRMEDSHTVFSLTLLNRE